MPVIAGLLSLNSYKFLLGVIPSALLWSLVYLSPGILYGSAAMYIPKTYFNLFFKYAVICLIITFYYRFQSQIANFITNIIKRYTKQTISLYYVWLSLNFIISWTILAMVWHGVATDTGLSIVNKPLYYFLQSIRTHELDTFMFTMTLFGTKTFVIPFILVWLSYLIKNGYKDHAQHFVTIVAFTFILTHAIKLFAHVERPPIGNMLSATYSFPSGHTSIVVAIMASLCWSCSLRKGEKSYLPSILFTTVILATGLSRLYLGMHWLTDIIAAFLLIHPTILLTELIIKKKKRIKFKTMATMFFVVFSFASMISIFVLNDNLPYHYSSKLEKTKIIIGKQGLNIIPISRFNRTHTYKSPLNVRFIGSLYQIDQAMHKINLEKIKENQLLKPVIINENHIENQLDPTFKPLLYHQAPVRTYTQVTSTNTLLVVRLWETPYQYESSPVYMGSAYIDKEPLKPQMWYSPKRSYYDVTFLKDMPLRRSTKIVDEHSTDITNWTREIITFYATRP